MVCVEVRVTDVCAKRVLWLFRLALACQRLMVTVVEVHGVVAVAVAVAVATRGHNRHQPVAVAAMYWECTRGLLPMPRPRHGSRDTGMACWFLNPPPSPVVRHGCATVRRQSSVQKAAGAGPVHLLAQVFGDLYRPTVVHMCTCQWQRNSNSATDHHCHGSCGIYNYTFIYY